MIPRSFLNRVRNPKRNATPCHTSPKLLTMSHPTSPNTLMRPSMITSASKRCLAAFWTLIALSLSLSPTWGATIKHQRAASGQHVILLAGEITASDPARIREAIKASKGATAITVVLDSSGGVLYPAMEIGRMLRKAQASTVAVRLCASACHVIWASGVSRYVVAGSQLAIHFPFREYGDSKEPAFDAFSDLSKYYRDMGATVELSLDIASSDPKRLKILDLNDAKRHGLAFATIDQ